MHKNELLVRESYQAMTNGDGSKLAALLLPSTKWIICGDGALAGTYTGPDEIFQFWKTVASKTGGGLSLELGDVLANNDRVVALVNVTGKRGENLLDERQIVIFELSDSKVTSATFVYEQQKRYDAFWA